jgi:osmoprotectant transport system permease protein
VTRLARLARRAGPTRLALLALAVVAGCAPAPGAGPAAVVVGSKKFTESVVLGEMAALLARRAGATATRTDLGGTPLVWRALLQGDIDVYPEYTGTIRREILNADPPDLAAALAERGVRVSRPLGFRNNYALGMRADVAAAKGIRTTSDLRAHPGLRLGFTHEFIDRPDGWRGLKPHYQLPHPTPTGLEHALAYRGLAEGAIDVMELYTTDAEIAVHGLTVLDDDRRFFPTYDAVWLYRGDLEARAPGVVEQLRRLEGRVTEDDMRRLNARVKLGEATEPAAAAEFLARALGDTGAAAPDETLAQRVWQTTVEHLRLVVPSLLAAVLVAVPLGVLAARRPAAGQVLLGATGVIQTIPALALLLFMIPVTKALFDRGIGPAPAVACLFLYSLLPVARNTHAGLTGIPAALRESAAALGLPSWAVLWRVELPLAAPTILAGVKTAAVINVGTATLGGLIGAGGYGRPILRGIDKLDVPLMLEGAVPAAVMALAAQAVFELAERALARRWGGPG